MVKLTQSLTQSPTASLTSAEALAAFPRATALAPEAFLTTQWYPGDLGTGGAIEIVITELPSDGGSPITDIEVFITDQPTQSLGATVPGAYPISGLPNNELLGVAIRCLNAIGPAPWSNTKAVTPTEPAEP